MLKKTNSKRTFLCDSQNLSTMDTLIIFCELIVYESELKSYSEEDEDLRK